MVIREKRQLWKKLTAVAVTAVTVCSLMGGGVYAEDGAAEEVAQEAAEEVAAEAAVPEMAAPIDEPVAAPAESVVSSVIATNEIDGWPKASEKESDYVCLLETATGTVLINKNMDAQSSPASLAKIMTILVAIEQGNLNDKVTMTQTGVDLAVAGSANLYTEVGESFTLRDMLYGVMLASANDMAMQVAEYVGGGSVDNFVAMMNEKAEELGCTGTHFVNPTGLTADGQVSTAHDLAVICAAALENPEFRDIASAETYTIAASEIYAPRELVNNFPCISDPENYRIDGVYGGKTGYTDAALNCIAAFCNRSEREEVLVALHSPDMAKSVRDASESFKYGYNKWKVRKVKPAKGEELLSGGKVVLPKKKKVKDCEKNETATDADGGMEQVETTYLWSGVPVGTSTILRVKPTPAPTSAPAVTEAAPAALPTDSTGTGFPLAATTGEGFSGLSEALNGGAAAGTPSGNGAETAAPGAATQAVPAGAEAGTADVAGTVAGAPNAAGTQVGMQDAAGVPAVGTQDAAGAQAGTQNAAGGQAVGTQDAAGAQAGVQGAPQVQTTDTAEAPETKAAQKVSLPLGVTMNRNAFIAIAVLSLLILLGIILILLTAVFRRGKD